MDHSVVTTTRRGLHAIAELLLSGPQYRSSGTIRLRVLPGGIGTRADPDLRLDGTDLVAGEQRFAIAGSSVASLAAAVGVVPGAPAGLYSDGSGVDPEHVLELDSAAAALIIEGFAIGDAALREFQPSSEPVVWPEHFDVGIVLDDVAYGVSPGDSFLDEPYAYLSVVSPPQHPFFDAPFGAARPISRFAGVDEVVEYFHRGRRLLS